MGNGLGGVLASAPSVTIGGTAAGARNVISANPIGISGSAATLIVQGNYIGTDVTGAAALPNAGAGIAISGGNAIIGGIVTGARNIISGNSADGVDVNGGSGTEVSGNYIGTNAAGTGPLPNGQLGVSVSTPSVVINDDVISANPAGGIALSSSGALVTANLIGLNASGAAAAMGNGGDGIAVTGANNVIGDGSGQTHNVIAQNVNGISVTGAAATGTVIQSNYI